MKRIITAFGIAFLAISSVIIVSSTINSCGPGANEIAEKTKLDSIAKADSVAATVTVSDTAKKDTIVKK